MYVYVIPSDWIKEYKLRKFKLCTLLVGGLPNWYNGALIMWLKPGTWCDKRKSNLAGAIAQWE